MDEIPFEKRFHFQDGSDVKDLAELKRKIESLPYHEFYRHVNAEKNDFANWVEHVLRRKDLADRLRGVSSIVETVEILNEEIFPEDVLHAEEGLKARGGFDFQERIEEQLFSLEPKDEAAERVPDFEEELAETQMEVKEVEPDEERAVDDEEPRLPSREEVALAGRVPGAPVTSRERPHTPITQRVERADKEEHLRFVVKQFLYGFLFGIIVGLILGRIVSMFF